MATFATYYGIFYVWDRPGVTADGQKNAVAM
jgi:hypothetical protein